MVTWAREEKNARVAQKTKNIWAREKKNCRVAQKTEKVWAREEKIIRMAQEEQKTGILADMRGENDIVYLLRGRVEEK